MKTAGRLLASPVSRRLHRGLTLAVMVAGTVGFTGMRHDIHTTHTRAVVENGTILWKVRLFSDDLEKGLRGYARRPGFSLAGDAKADSIFTAYFNARVTVTADGRPVSAKLVQTGTDRDPVGGTVHWYLLQFDTAKQPAVLTVANTLLSELFGNQANIVVLLAMPGETRHSLYFASGDRSAQVVTLR